MFVCISTRNRSHFYEWTKRILERQTLQPTGVIIVDGSETPSAFQSWPNAIYHHEPNLILGASRNRAIHSAIKAGAEFISIWDDDDYYSEHHLEKAVDLFKKNPKDLVAGSSMTPVYFKEEGEIWICGPYHSNHAIEPSMVFRSELISKEGCAFQEDDSLGRGQYFLKNWNFPILQMSETHILVAHSENTFNKQQIRLNPHGFGAAKSGSFKVPPILNSFP
jgi:hypothetical protein